MGDLAHRQHQRHKNDDIPWDIGGPQPALARLLSSTSVGPRVLDIGCGTGELALWVAAHPGAPDTTVTGIDLAHEAIDRAMARAQIRGLAVDFRVADAVSFGEAPEVYDTVLDSGLLHSLDDRDVEAYVRSLARLTRPGGAVRVLAAAHHEQRPWGLTPEQLRAIFASEHWSETAVVPAEVLGGVDGSVRMPGHLVTTRRTRTPGPLRGTSITWHWPGDGIDPFDVRSPDTHWVTYAGHGWGRAWPAGEPRGWGALDGDFLDEVPTGYKSILLEERCAVVHRGHTVREWDETGEQPERSPSLDPTESVWQVRSQHGKGPGKGAVLSDYTSALAVALDRSSADDDGWMVLRRLRHQDWH
ncbi:class I SAM-dependent methyltransferase [Luteipulveratus mongoliensis]|uniref:class I SAM-dependent methyltransferase n=1 Tax=Luteipulveratus mongoliensis TaxID=571913 RepID=UPI000696116F|nr:class I SAM-dependent methyltransferase [Luteipulveratus mongoliensis]